jgi:hypothetical protein
MIKDREQFPRAVFDEHGDYTVLRGASYLVDDPALRELAAITYARRDLQQAHEFLQACTHEGLDDVHPLLEQSLWSAAIVTYGKPFGRNDARSEFKPEPLIQAKLSEDGLRVHEYLKRCRDWMIAHDDGLGESKAISIYLPATAPRSILEIGLHLSNSRIVALGTDIARQLEPHFAQVRDLLLVHEESFRRKTASQLLESRFEGINLLGEAVDEPLAVDLESVLALPTTQRKKR